MKAIYLSLLLMLSISACDLKTDKPVAVFTPIEIMPTAQDTQLDEHPATQTPDTEASPPSIWVDPHYPAAVHKYFNESANFEVVQDQQEGTLTTSAVSGIPVGSWTYILVSPFQSLREDIPTSDLLNLWQNGNISSFPDLEISLSEETYNALILLWGDPDPNGLLVVDAELIRPSQFTNIDSLAIIPFEEINPHWKILSIGDQNPLNSDFDIAEYPLTLPLYISSLSDPLESLNLDDPILNFDPNKLTTIALTGVTALVRDTASIMEEKGVLYPAEDIRFLLESADITHISNEVPFAIDCPFPSPDQESLYFCSKDEYIQLLEAVGTDIVELSGDHFGDWGPEAMLHSIDLYHSRNWLTYGGGENLSAGLQPVYIEHNGNNFAFIGCNGKVHDKYATASETNPGASRCDFDWMLSEITLLTQQGYLVIATMQHEEIDSFAPVAIQYFDFRNLANAGAVIVSGSQAHHPQTVEITDSSFIHYGLGNLFFDQWYLAHYSPKVHANKDKAFIDLHHFYAGSYISTQLVTLQFIDNAKPRFMTAEERYSFLTEVFKVPLWNYQVK
ncbi:MAG: CapA family protein [Anaerolineales bacterium]|nr:CapA family protein [Anaerolineales bacterium]